MEKYLTLSVHQLVDFLLRTGDIDNRVFNRSSMTEGSRLHSAYQSKQSSNYMSEFPLKMSFNIDEVNIVLEGRADGIIKRSETEYVIDEIKTTVEDLKVFHDDNQIYAVAPDLPDDIEKNIVPIRTVCSSLPLPEDYFDVVIVDTVDVTPDRMAQLLLSLRIGGLFIQVLPAGKVIPCTIPNADSFSDDEGNTLLRARMSRDLTAVFREGTMKGRLNRQKRLVSYILDELGDSLGSILASDDDLRLEAAITQAALAEENILPIYEELISEDIKYLANRFKESLIEFRLHRSEKTRTRVFEEYLALRREMREYDDF